MGILAAIAIPRFSGVKDGAEVNAHNSNVAAIESAIELALANDEEIIGESNEVDLQVLVDLGYLSSVPANPIKAGDGLGEYSATATKNADDSTVTIYNIEVTPKKQ